MEELLRLHQHPEAFRPPAADTTDAQLPLWRETFAGLDWFSLKCSPVYRGHDVPRGNGTPVVLIPGMMASDLSMRELARWLRRMDYRPYLSGIGRNDSCPELSLAAVVRTVDRAFDETGMKVHIVGHSLGGLLARGAAVVRPRQVAQVVTLGTPVHGARVHPFVRMVAENLRGGCDGECIESLQRPLPDGVDELNVFSRHDGIVNWRTCLRPDAESAEVQGTHVGLIVNAQVYRALAGALAPRRAPVTRTRKPLPARSRLCVVERLAA